MLSALHSAHLPSAPSPSLKPCNLPGVSVLTWARPEPAGTALAEGKTFKRFTAVLPALLGAWWLAHRPTHPGLCLCKAESRGLGHPRGALPRSADPVTCRDGDCALCTCSKGSGPKLHWTQFPSRQPRREECRVICQLLPAFSAVICMKGRGEEEGVTH